MLRFGTIITFLFTALVCGTVCAQEDVTQYVQTMSGTAAATTPAALKHALTAEALFANTIPAVGVPFAMVQWTPQTQITEHKCIPPYYYKDSSFSGFRASHWLSGSCTQDYGSVTIMPISGKLNTEDYSVSYEHKNEQASPQEYTISLNSIRASVTGTRRCGIMQFTAIEADSLYLLITPNSDYNEGFVKIDKKTGNITGYNPVHRIYQGWGQKAGFSGYFFIETSKKQGKTGCFSGARIFAIDSLKNNEKLGGYIGFKLKAGETIKVKVGTSFSSIEEAQKNLMAEIPGWDFNTVSAKAKQTWQKALAQIQIETDSKKDKRIFYTAFYHAMQHPRLFNDVDGTYPAFATQYKNNTISGDYYDDFSMWDIYRAQLPLIELLRPKMTEALIQSLLLKGQQAGWMPIFPCWNSYTSEMIGDHATAFIAAAYMKGIRGYDVDAAYTVLRKNAFEQPETKAVYVEGKGRRALDSYLKYGYIPLEDSVPDAFHKKEQVSRTLEYAFDDYALAAMAKRLGKTDDLEKLMQRAGYYKNVFDTTTRLVRGRHNNGAWISPFLPDSKQPYITEGTPRQYTFYVPQDVPGLAKLMGGQQFLKHQLDSIFQKQEYWHGNEPGHQIPFMYNFTDAPWKTQKQVRKILAEEYSDGPGGLSGNDDAGQMSAWYMFAAMGFYPLDPVSGEYMLCAPIFKNTTISLPGDKKLEIATLKDSPNAAYIREVRWNGKKQEENYITYKQIIGGGKLEILMQEKPAYSWGAKASQQAGSYPAINEK